MTGPKKRPTPPESLLATSRAVRFLRPDVESATGAAFAGLRLGSVPVVWESAGWRAQALKRVPKPVLTVAPGPLLSPYDTPETGLASLRIALGGRAFGGTEPDAGIADLLRARRLAGENRHPKDAAAIEAALAGRATMALALVEAQQARSPRRLQAFLRKVLAACPDRPVLAAGPAGCPRLDGLGPRLVAVAEPVDPWLVFERADRVFVERREAGCEAGLAGVEVVSMDPDAPPGPFGEADLRRRYGEGVHYFDPWTRRPIAMAEAVERVAWLRDRFVANDRPTVLVGISRWKRPAIDVFAKGPHGPPLHVMTTEDAIRAATARRARVQVWATRMPETLPALCVGAGLELSRIEDGFLRSVGLGASLKLGASIVVDDTGIYYDPRTVSRLTRLLKETAFGPALTARARALREAIVARRLSKYNVGLSEAPAGWPTDRRIVLVPGQVEDDASVQYGSPHVRTNLGLLRAARARNPDAFLLYKPHPDVEAGFRPGAIPEAEALRLADRLVGGLAIVDLLDRVHHVETMTSLAGFEALIRGLTVATYGRPFYSGWGLTEDLAPNAARGRKLALDELVAGALILYPRYLDPVAMKPCEPEQLLDRLSAAREAAVPSRLSLNALQHAAMRARYAVLNPIVRHLRSRRGVKAGADAATR